MIEKLGAIVFLVVFMTIFSFVGGYAVTAYGAGSDTTITSNDLSTVPTQPSVWSIVNNSAGFITGLTSFGVTGTTVPIYFALLAWVVDAIAIAVVILIVRGN